MLHSFEFDEYSRAPTGRKRFKPYSNLMGFNKQMLLEVEEFEEAERRYRAGEKLTFDEETKSRLVRAVRCMTNIYFILAPEQMLIKIGQARDVGKRLSSLKTSSPCELRLLASVRSYGDFEFYLHKRLKESRAQGEWFRPDDRVLSVVEAAIDGGVRQILDALQINVDDL